MFQKSRPDIGGVYIIQDRLFQYMDVAGMKALLLKLPMIHEEFGV